MKMKTKIWIVLFVVALILIAGAVPVLALSTMAIDGSFTDWVGNASFVDPGGADDETSPSRADITEFRAFADSGGLYLLKAWDNSSFTGGQATTAGVTLRTAANAYYRVYTTAQGNPGAVQLSTMDVNSCSDSTCSNQTDVCDGAGCTGGLLGSGTTWADPFTGRASPGCSGTNCGTLDTAVELYLPWALIGGAPGDGQFIFLQFGSFPSGPAQAPKDDTGTDGISCRNTNGSLLCYSSSPTLVRLSNFRAAALESKSLSLPGFALIISLILGAAGVVLRKKASTG